MRSEIVFSLLVLVWGNVNAQEVSIVRQSDRELPREKNKSSFHYLEDGIDTTALIFVATLEVRSPANPSVERLFDGLREKAKRMGANAMKLHHFDQSNISIIADVYKISEDFIHRNNALKPQNTLHIFAGDLYEKAGYYSFEFNGGVKTLRNGTYFKYALKEGEQAKLRKGMITGTIMWVKWKPNQMPNFYTIHGFSNEAVVKRTTVSDPSKPGKFQPVDDALGAFLVKVLEEKKD